MSSYNKILVAIDVTEDADAVVATAQAIAQKNGSELHFLTAVTPVNYAYSGYDAGVAFTALANFESEAHAAALANLQARAKQLGAPEDRVAVVLGKPANVIKEHASAMNTDLIVMGSHCRKGLGLLLGSTANGVLHGAPCDVLIVRIED